MGELLAHSSYYLSARCLSSHMLSTLPNAWSNKSELVRACWIITPIWQTDKIGVGCLLYVL